MLERILHVSKSAPGGQITGIYLRRIRVPGLMIVHSCALILGCSGYSCRLHRAVGNDSDRYVTRLIFEKELGVRAHA